MNLSDENYTVMVDNNGEIQYPLQISTFLDANNIPDKNYVDNKVKSLSTEYIDYKYQTDSNIIKIENEYKNADTQTLNAAKSYTEGYYNEKYNGVLHFNGGYVIGPKDDFLGTFDTLSICQTVKINNYDFENYNFLFSLGAFGIRNFNDAIAFYIYKNTSATNKPENFGFSVIYDKGRHSELTEDYKEYTNYSTGAFTKILDGKFHTITLIFKAGEKLKLCVDGDKNPIAESTIKMPYSLVRGEISSDYKYYSYGVGCRPAPAAPSALKSATISRCEVFNFDITATGAPYSLNDYQNGKPIPSYLLMGNNGERFNVKDAVEDTVNVPGNYALDNDNCVTTFTETNGVYTIGKTEKSETTDNYQAYFYMKLSSTIKAGSLVKVNLKRYGDSLAWRIGFAPDYKEKTSSDEVAWIDLHGGHWNGDVPKTNTVILPVDCNGACIRVAKSFDSFSFTDLSIEVIGAELALENFTFDGKVLDYSGNSRYGTVYNSVAGNNDTKVETLYQQFKERFKSEQ